jgi:hypothetical protein
MDDETRKLLDGIIGARTAKKSEVLVCEFKRALNGAGVEIKEDPQAKYFAAGMDGVEVLVLAHESAEVGWWGITEDIVKRVLEANARREKAITWGAALIDKSHSRGFWIRGENILQLKALGLVKLGKVQYHFKHDDLERRPGRAPYFWTIAQFLAHSGLKPS